MHVRITQVGMIPSISVSRGRFVLARDRHLTGGADHQLLAGDFLDEVRIALAQQRNAPIQPFAFRRHGIESGLFLRQGLAGGPQGQIPPFPPIGEGAEIDDRDQAHGGKHRLRKRTADMSPIFHGGSESYSVYARQVAFAAKPEPRAFHSFTGKQ